MIISLVGEDSFQALEVINQLKNKYLEKNPDGSELTEADYPEKPMDFANLHALPLFATSRLIIIKRVEILNQKLQEKLSEYLTNLPTTTNIIIWASRLEDLDNSLQLSLSKADKKILVSPLSNLELKKWVTSRANNLSIKTNDEFVEDLMTQFGGDLWAIKTELETLAQSLDTPETPKWQKIQSQDVTKLFQLMRRPDLKQTSLFIKKLADLGTPVELVIGMLTASAKKLPNDMKMAILNLLVDIDYGVKVGFLDNSSALLLLSEHLLQPAANRLKWEEIWQNKVWPASS